MPLDYIIIHVLATALCVCVGLLVPLRYGVPLRVLSLLLIIGSFAIERWPDWAWASMGWGIRDLIFLSNLSLEAMSLLLILMWREAIESGKPAERPRAAVFSTILMAGVLWSYNWIFAPMPPVHGQMDSQGFLRQTSTESCAAAAAVMLLHQSGIETNEKEMAALCVTRAGIGTRPSGLYRGLAIKGAERKIRPQLITLRPEDLNKLGKPVIATVGITRSTPDDITNEMLALGWAPGKRHAITVFSVSPDGQWVDVADPESGRHRWPMSYMPHLWDDRVLVMMPA